jgi:spore germination protein KC
MTFKKEDEILPAQNLQLMMEEYVQTSKIPNIQLFDIYKDAADGITDPMTAVVRIGKGPEGKAIMQMDGAAVFHNNRLCGYLDKAGTRGYLWIKGSAQGGIVTVRLANGATASMEVLNSSSKIEVSGDEKAPVVKVDIKLASNLAEVQSPTQYNVDSTFISNLEKLQSKTVSDEAYKAVNRALKGYKADIFGFGLDFYENKPELWRKLSTDWKTDISKIKVEITVNSSVRHTGLTAQTVFAGNNNTAKAIKQ